jgi:dUTP pyrophosphatase
MTNSLQKPITLKWKRLRATAQIPKKQSAGAACFDLCADLSAPMTVEPGKVVAIPTGLAVEIPLGFELQVRARSGLAFKNGLCLVNGIGTIDSDYRGELKVIVTILGGAPLTINHGDRIAQALVAPVLEVNHIEAVELSDTERGAGGFGSTGVSK